MRTALEVSELKVDIFDKKFIKSRIEMPSMQKSKYPQENGYVLNFIKTQKPLDSYPSRTLCAGGFTSIRITEVDYWYISSSNVGTLKMMDEIEGIEPLKKRIVIKR